MTTRLPLSLLAALALLLGLAASASAATLVAERTGGIAGVQDRLVLRADGTATRTTRQSGVLQLSRADTRGLRRALRASRFATLAPRYAPEGTIADAFEYRLRHRGHTVVVVEGGQRLPERLQRLLTEVGGLLAASRR